MMSLGSLPRFSRSAGVALRSVLGPEGVCVTRGARPGLCPSNADAFLNPFGPPVVQVSSEDGAFLDDCARRGVDVHVVAHVKMSSAEALNVTARIAGTNGSLPPLVVMTPRSGWWTCASERGGGMACWLELMRELRALRPRRAVLFVASSGHELGHLGLDAFIAERRALVKSAAAWLHLSRTVCRRAERAVVTLMRGVLVNAQVLIYLNRLSDFLFVLGRVANDGGTFTSTYSTLTGNSARRGGSAA